MLVKHVIKILIELAEFSPPQKVVWGFDDQSLKHLGNECIQHAWYYVARQDEGNGPDNPSRSQDWHGADLAVLLRGI